MTAARRFRCHRRRWSSAVHSTAPHSRAFFRRAVNSPPQLAQTRCTGATRRRLSRHFAEQYRVSIPWAWNSAEHASQTFSSAAAGAPRLPALLHAGVQYLASFRWDVNSTPHAEQVTVRVSGPSRVRVHGNTDVQSGQVTGNVSIRDRTAAAWYWHRREQ